MGKPLSKRTKEKFPFLKSNLGLEERIDDLLSRLTLKEKFRLLSGRNFSFWTTNPIRRLKIKPLGMTDGPNGIAFHSSYRRNTQFPASICLGASWNREIAKEFGVVVAREIRAVGRHVILAPGINIDRTPLNGRTFEYLSEDPYLIKELAIPFVKGVQSERIGACVKHYVANNQETNRFKVSAEIDERTLNEIYLRAFKDVVKGADPWILMACYNKINGVYGCEHKQLLRDTLMDQWGFKGYVVSDWWATKYLEKPENCIHAGLSLEMPKPFAYKMNFLKKAFKEGKFSEEALDYVIRKLLRVMFLVGLFDDPKKIPPGERNTAKHQAIARRMAEEGVVLLKNENNLLPLSINEIKKLAVIGPNAKKRMGRFLYGGSSAVIPPYEITPLKGLKEKCKGKITFTSDPSVADVCIIFAGLNHDKGNDAEDVDRTQLELPENQIELINQTVSQNPKTIVVLISGSPIAMAEWIDNVPAILEAWYPGMEGGKAVVNVLFGDVNPSGKLPLTFPKKLSDSPAHKSQRTYPGNDKVYYEEGVFVGYRHFDKENIEPLFPFGYGLSYTTFSYENLKLSSSKINEKESVTVSVDISNTGNRFGAEVVQLYIQEDNSRIDRPPKELKGFEKITLKPDEKKTVNFTITTEDLAFYDESKHQWVVESGTFTVLIGSSSRDIHLQGKLSL